MGTSKLLFSMALVTSLMTSAQGFAQSYIFGIEGRNGQSGFSGQSGSSGRDVTITATGQSENLDLSGGDGDSGAPGSEGSDAYNCHQGRPLHDLRGADGGDGGSGGDGGRGGSGGDILVYASAPANLKSIFVDSTPGRGGYAGYGARGGAACRCWNSSWQGQVCHNETVTEQVCVPAGCRPGTAVCECKQVKKTVQVCNYRTFYCNDGREGRTGSTGAHGSNGSYGSIKIVNRVQPLEPVTPSTAVPVETSLSGAFELTRHEWNALSGAPSLFAAGSKIRNDYEQYAGKTVKTVSFNWLDSVRKVDYFRGNRASLGLQGYPASVGVSFDSGMLADFNTETNGNHTTVRVNRAMKRNELTTIRVEEMVGANEDLTLVLIDDSKVSDISKTRIVIDSGWDLEGGGEYDREVPQNLIKSEAGRIEVNIGRVPGVKKSKISKYFGDKCEFEMEVTREFAGASSRVVRDGGNVFDIVKEVKKKKAIKVKMEKE